MPPASSETAATSYRKFDQTTSIPISTPIPIATNPWYRSATGPMKKVKGANKPATSTTTKSTSQERLSIKTATSCGSATTPAGQTKERNERNGNGAPTFSITKPICRP